MDTNGQRRRAAATGELLQQLLRSQQTYVRAWRVHGDRQRGEINQRAVAKVLALYLWDEGIRPDSDRTLPVKLKNVVYRAFSGERLTATTLEHFIGAFAMAEEDQKELWQTFLGADGVAQTVTAPRGMARQQWHRTMALFERYYVDDQRNLSLRRTVQCIEAREDGVDSYLFNHEPSVTEISVTHGGRIGRHYEYGGGLISDDIVLDQTLRKGDRAALEYTSRYEPGNGVTEVRRPARGRTSNVTVAVHFTPQARPARLWFSVWSDHMLGGPVQERIVPLERSGQACMCLPYIEQTVIGFRWEWAET
ncbi:hypothetical protein [Micromonospora sp. WMMD712]|uniref:hypothetical protein n=1 Tax=Micromonospora sp. WMMD712 TaxID=3016096 RepID=UPI00249C9769|nr:hypothetical protein [Micromonospora sp. WMMD712]WFE59222.1 hypothetical protein O7633_21335 [Micromonospora sp. WMMD712]